MVLKTDCLTSLSCCCYKIPCQKQLRGEHVFLSHDCKIYSFTTVMSRWPEVEGCHMTSTFETREEGMNACMVLVSFLSPFHLSHSLAYEIVLSIFKVSHPTSICLIKKTVLECLLNSS